MVKEKIVCIIPELSNDEIQVPDIGSDLEESTLNVTEWKKLYERTLACKSFTELENLFKETDISCLDDVSKTIQEAQRFDQINTVATAELPEDVPRNFVPTVIYSEGICFPRAICEAMYGNEDCHLEICMRMLIQGNLNVRRYLDHNHLSVGTNKNYKSVTFPLVFAQYCGEYQCPNIPPNVSSKERQAILDMLVIDVYQKRHFSAEKIRYLCGNVEYIPMCKHSWQTFKNGLPIKRK